ncbi:MAG: hypothetical protein Q4A98_10610, partial [Comamonadaceae bacterium]|nr:hypothetical protein [Comamonadaceae bacterium]
AHPAAGVRQAAGESLGAGAGLTDILHIKGNKIALFRHVVVKVNFPLIGLIEKCRDSPRHCPSSPSPP